MKYHTHFGVGDGPSAATYGELHGSSTRIYCRPGFKSHAELAEVYASCDLHVSASEFETLGNTVLEAHSCGIPVVVPRTQVRPCHFHMLLTLM
jgi:glycosyltransferase involved in cell wall biosynthesis